MWLFSNFCPHIVIYFTIIFKTSTIQEVVVHYGYTLLNGAAILGHSGLNDLPRTKLFYETPHEEC